MVYKMEPYRSDHSGFIASIKAILLFLFPLLICFSRSIAETMNSCNSYHTRMEQVYRWVKEFVDRILCWKM